MKFGIIGHPVSHSRSPQLFAEAFPGSVHTYELIEEADFEKAYSRFIEGFTAVNVTAPFKEKAFLKADAAEEVTALLRATNLLQKTPDGIKAWNTDYLGVRELLKLHYPSGKLLVMGCGGAGKAAAMAGASLGLDVYVANRNAAKAAEFASLNPARLKGISLDEAVEAVKECGMVIYTIPGPSETLSQMNLEGKILMEANYRDPIFGEGNGYRYIDGMHWLRAQAVSGFEIMMSSEEK